MANLKTFIEEHGLVILSTIFVIFGLTAFIQGSIERDRQEKIDSLVNEPVYCLISHDTDEYYLSNTCVPLIEKNLDILESSYGIKFDKGKYLMRKRLKSLISLLD